ncbi:pyruvate dehydrogenase (acetyl-transferring) E1 component subunit alpha [Fusibacter ferrireducens]|uniref:Pyruvate dehydrogenase E1 component subunit alpha n=1 Tax=Fusibacter ferrireducens TaxID=2785058 RepID=A0ABR9ZQG3_9FIRM|nr:pyruvate dehydrogenase (acetyl-transferring) E1 component subunit alpha [Fusibacter ferrireducens]MBF4692697.1 pyruvate dehydrogenase (acetyl-transferring) E1 component subunit alpha [Fusibacter ferrireducens]
MFLENANPLVDEMIQILNPEGEVVKPEWMPELSKEMLLKMYKTMRLSRIIDEKTLQYQRQGRMLTYAPNLGQEAAQVGSAAAIRQSDWVAPSFRELGVWLYKGAPLYNVFLYWFGNELGMKMPEEVRILPVSIPIASQMQHAAGLAYATKLKGEDDVTIAYVGDGGTSQGDFHEALNFASVKNTPNVFVIQNNQFAISTRRAIQSKAKTMAQKAIGYGIPGIQVDGNDIFAMYAVTKEAVERARNGEGPTLIEAYTYRLGAHTTSDDPTVYRDESEVEEWRKKDPIDRLRIYLFNQGFWSEAEEEAFVNEQSEFVKQTFEAVEQSGLTPLEDVFDYVYAEKTPILETQYQERKAFYAKEGK